MGTRRAARAGIRGLAAAALVMGANAAAGQASLPAGAWTTVDEAELVPAEAGPDFWLGRRADLDGDTLAVSGGLGGAGAVFVFVREPTGWREQARIQPPSSEPLTGACALDGDTLVAGAYTEDLNGFQSGAVFVFHRSGETWTLQHVLRASDPLAEDRFGYAVDVKGDVLMVGAPRHLVKEPGKAYVFRYDGSAWSEEAILQATSGADELGHEVAIAGDTAMAAAYERHSCFVFRQVGGTWLVETELVGETPDEGFGETASLSGDTVVVGAPHRSGDQGALYVFVRQGSTWEQQAVLTGSAVAGDFLGSRVAVDGDLALAASAADEGRPAAGCAVVFRRSGSQWAELGRLVSRTPRSHSGFGSAVTLDGSTVAVGAFLADVVGSRSGAAYVFPLFQGEASNYGESNPNSAGVVARMALAGTPSLVGGTTLYTVGAPADKSGLFFYGTQTANLAFGNGVLCVSPFSPGLRRLPPLVGTDAFGTAWNALDPARLPPGTQPGTTLFFQFWFRDLPGGGAYFNLSDGLGVTFEP